MFFIFHLCIITIGKFVKMAFILFSTGGEEAPLIIGKFVKMAFILFSTGGEEAPLIIEIVLLSDIT